MQHHLELVSRTLNTVPSAYPHTWWVCCMCGFHRFASTARLIGVSTRWIGAQFLAFRTLYSIIGRLRLSFGTLGSIASPPKPQTLNPKGQNYRLGMQRLLARFIARTWEDTVYDLTECRHAKHSRRRQPGWAAAMGFRPLHDAKTGFVVGEESRRSWIWICCMCTIFTN